MTWEEIKVEKHCLVGGRFGHCWEGTMVYEGSGLCRDTIHTFREKQPF